MDVLSRQQKYGFELVNNNDFWDWAKEGITLCSDVFAGAEELTEEQLIEVLNCSHGYAELEEWTDKFEEVFGSYIEDGDDPHQEIHVASPIREIKDFNQAMYVLHNFRANMGLESINHWGGVGGRRLFTPINIGPQDYQMCATYATKQQAEILTKIIVEKQVDFREDYYYPMLDNLIDWIDSKYKPTA